MKGLVVLVGVLMISSVLLAAPAADHGKNGQAVQQSTSRSAGQPSFVQRLKGFLKHLGVITEGAIWG